MSEYRRPALPDEVFVDDDGTPYRYGGRWGMDGPPPSTYSHDSHPERFAPLAGVLDAVVEHLVTTYDVAVSPDPPAGPPAFRPLVRGATLIPSDPDAAVLGLFLTDYPGVWLRAGVLVGEGIPQCGCDACDEPLMRSVEELEERVFAVVGGGLRESVQGTMVEAGWPQGWSRGPRGDLPPAVLAAARDRLSTLPGGRWSPWTRRVPSRATARG